jgi:lipopolysaccharide export system permease protein
MSRLSRYVLNQLIGPIGLFSLILTGVVWLSQSLRLLDLIINRGQSAPTFLYLTLLMLPSLLVIILPIAYFAGTLFGLNKLNSDSELVAMTAAGYTRWQLAKPVLVAATIVMALTYLCSLWLMPLGQRMMKDKVVDIRADLGAAILSEGTFNTPAKGLTVFIRSLSSDGHIGGILVHDNRDPAHPNTYLAEGGVLAQTPAGARLIMYNGTVEKSAKAGAKLLVLKFKRYVFDLDQFANQHRNPVREIHERYLPELFWPKLPKPNPKVVHVFWAEGHNRLAEPLYALAFAFIAMAAITRGRRARGALALRLTVASVLAGGLRILGYGVQGIGARNPEFNFLIYLVPLGGAALAWFYLSEYWPGGKIAAEAPEPETETGPETAS